MPPAPVQNVPNMFFPGGISLCIASSITYMLLYKRDEATVQVYLSQEVIY